MPWTIASDRLPLGTPPRPTPPLAWWQMLLLFATGVLISLSLILLFNGRIL